MGENIGEVTENRGPEEKKGEINKKKVLREVFNLAGVFIIAITLSILVKMYIFIPVKVDGPSMQTTLWNKESLIVTKYDYYFSDPERFDVIVFDKSEEDMFVKRIIGVPGENVYVEGNELYIDGEKIGQDFLGEGTITDEFNLEELEGNYDVIPEGKYLVLGDNRENSLDSRGIGLIDKEAIVGKVKYVMWPMASIKAVK